MAGAPAYQDPIENVLHVTNKKIPFFFFIEFVFCSQVTLYHQTKCFRFEKFLSCLDCS